MDKNNVDNNSIAEEQSITSTAKHGVHFCVVLTGSTGNLGAYILDRLLSQPEVTKIVCLNRSSNARGKQLAAHKDRGLTLKLFDNDASKPVTFLQADFGDETLGLERDVYEYLKHAADLVIHNAWPVDFNRNFNSFKPSISGVMNLIRFCSTERDDEEEEDGELRAHAIKILFISSIGATSNWSSAAPSSRSQVPEAEITDWKVARTGYGQSKLISERLLCHAALTKGLQTAIVRVGQLGGPVSYGTLGKWTEREWIPSLIKSSIALKAIPATLGPTEIVDWVPVDLCAATIEELVLDFGVQKLDDGSRKRKQKKPTSSFFHVVNPHQVNFAELVPTIRRYLPSDVKEVPFIEWVDCLKKSAEAAGGFQGVDEGINPAAKLIDFFDNLQHRAITFPYARVATLDTKNSVQVSRTMAGLEAVGPYWMELWMRQWAFADAPRS